MEAEQKRSPLDLIMNQIRRKASFTERKKPSIGRLFRPSESNERKNDGIPETTESTEGKDRIRHGADDRDVEVSSVAGWGRVKQFIQKLGKTPDAQSLNFGHCDLTATDLVELGTLLPFLAQLEHLDLSWNDLLGGSMKALTVNLQHVRKLKVLKLNSCRLTAQDLLALGEALESIPSLEVLDLSWNAGVGSHLHVLTSHLHLVSSLKELHLVDCHLTGADAVALGGALLQLPRLEVLDLSNNQLSETEGIERLAAALNSTPRLKTLKLSVCGLNRQSVATLGENMASLPDLEHLDLSSNKDSGGALTSLVESLSLIRRLRIFDLHLCCLTEEDIQALVRIVPVWTELEELDLSSNKKIGDVLQSLLPVLPSSKIKKLHLNNCGLSPQTFQALASVVQSLPHLENLDLSWNKCVGEHLGRLFESLQASSKLEELRLSSCDLTTEDVLHFESARKRGALLHLKRLDLSYNSRVGDGGWVSLFGEAAGLTELQELDVSLRPRVALSASPWFPAALDALPRMFSLRRLALRRWTLEPGQRQTLEKSLSKRNVLLECDDDPEADG